MDEYEGRERRRQTPRRQITPLEKTLLALDARAPSDDEISAVTALTRGTATPGQQRVAVAYIVAELCGAGRVAYGGEKGIFVNGARAVSVAIGQITNATYLRFPRGDPEENDER